MGLPRPRFRTGPRLPAAPQGRFQRRPRGRVHRRRGHTRAQYIKAVCGPLVNEKGDVIGINTFIRLDADSNRQTQTALGSDAIMGFLREKGIPFTEHQ